MYNVTADDFLFARITLLVAIVVLGLVFHELDGD